MKEIIDWEGGFFILWQYGSGGSGAELAESHENH